MPILLSGSGIGYDLNYWHFNFFVSVIIKSSHIHLAVVNHRLSFNAIESPTPCYLTKKWFRGSSTQWGLQILSAGKREQWYWIGTGLVLGMCRKPEPHRGRQVSNFQITGIIWQTVLTRHRAFIVKTTSQADTGEGLTYRDKHTFMLMFTHTGNLESLILSP